MAGAELNNDMLSVKEETITVMTPKGGTLQTYAFREAPYVFFRKGVYYFLWSVDDTGSPNYHVAYGTSDSPLGSIQVAKEPIILIQSPKEEVYGLTSQIRRCAVSIPSNIAEGKGRNSDREFVRFLQISLGSLYELQTQFELALSFNYISNIEDIFELSLEIEKMLNKLITVKGGRNV